MKDMTHLKSFRREWMLGGTAVKSTYPLESSLAPRRTGDKEEMRHCGEQRHSLHTVLAL